MRLERISLTDVRGVRSGSVEFDRTGVTVVEGPNESGKSTVVAAFELLLTKPHTSRHQLVRDLQPVGQDVAPTVTAEFTLGGYRVVYRKAWVRRPLAEVRIERDGGAVEQLTGADAEARVAQLLEEHVDVHLRTALNVLQGSSEFGVSAGGSVSVARALDRAAGQAGGAEPVVADAGGVGGSTPGPADAGSDTLLEAVTAEFLRYWTAKGNPIKERTDRMQALEQSERTLEELRGRLTEADEILPRLEAHRAELEDRAVTLHDAESSIDDLRGELEAARRLETEATAARAQVDLRDAQVEATSRAVADREVLREAVEAAQRAVDASRAALAESAPARVAADERLAAAEAAVVEARDAVERCQVEVAVVRADEAHLDREVNLTVLRERLGRVHDAVQARRVAQEVLDAGPVTALQLEEIEHAAAAAEEARIRAEAAAPVVTTTVLGAAPVTVDGEPVTGTDERPVPSSAQVEVADVVRVRVVPGADVEQLAGARDRAAAELADRCRAAGVEDLAGARRSSSVREGAERDLAAAIDTIQRDARDLSVGELETLVDRLASESASYLRGRPTSPELPADLPAAQTLSAEAQGRLEELQVRLASAEEAVASSRTARQELDVEHARGESRVSLEDERLAEATGTLDSARTTVADDALVAAVATAEQERDEAQTHAAALEARSREAAPDVTEERLRNAEGVIRSNRERAAVLEREIGGCEARLEEAGRAGLATQVDDVTAKVEHLRSTIDRTEARAAAAELLLRTLERHRNESRQRYLQPLRERIERYGRIVFGPDFEVVLDDDLQVVARRLGGVELPVHQLSIGAQEQLALVVRLALASLVEADDGAPVVIDDALGWSDRGRLESMCVALQAAGRDAQVIVLTCTPGRFAQIGGARVVTLTDGHDDAPRAGSAPESGAGSASGDGSDPEGAGGTAD